MSEINWDALRAAAKQAMANSYSPYSNFAVGAAALTDDGRVLRPRAVRRVLVGW
jgi:cytidine deaminase